MCGIVGFFDKTREKRKNLGEQLLRMLQALACRGPDSVGVAVFGDATSKQMIARVKLGDVGDLGQRVRQISALAKEFGAKEFSRTNAYLRFVFRETQDLKPFLS